MKRIVATFLLSMLPLAGQQAPQNPAPATAPAAQAPFKFSSLSQLVVEIVTVKDKAGNPIEGLTAKDFTITENGKPQTISFCDYEKIEDVGDTPVQVAEMTETAEKLPSVTRTEITPETPGSLRYRDKRLMALYFDMSAMPPPDQLRSLTAARKFIATQMTGPDLMAVMEYEGASVKVLQTFTNNRADLDKALLKLIVGDSQNGDSTNGDESDSDFGSAFGQDDSEFNIFTTDRQLAALQTAVQMLGNLNEKKQLIYFASGLRLSGVDNQAQMKAAANAAIRANVTLFTVDARGLVANSPLGDASQGSQGGVGMYTGGAQMAMANNFQRSQDTLYALAADTGGKALLDNNDLSMGIRNAQKALTSYYVLGYYTTDTTMDGKFRKISIALKDTNAKLEYRVGYYAGKVFAKFTSTDKERQLEDALMLGDPITDLTIHAELNYFQIDRAQYFIPVTVKIPGSELALARRGGAEHTLIDFIGEVKDEFNMTVSNVRDKVDIKLTGETVAQLTKRPIQYETGFTLLPGTYTVKILARDDETGRIGTYIHKFVIPNLNKEEKRIPISSVVLSGQRAPTREALYSAKDKEKGMLSNPLVQEGQELIPSVTRVFSKARDMYVYLQAYDQISPARVPLIAFVSFYRGQAKVFETSPLSVSEGMSNRLKTTPISVSLSLSKLPPGRYNCQVTVLDPTSQKAAFWQAPVVLVP